jgi:hypothetical protein
MLEIYAGGCAFLLVMAFCANLVRNEARFDAEMKMMVWFSILWPIMTLILISWIPCFIRERSEQKSLILLLEKHSQNEGSEATERF